MTAFFYNLPLIHDNNSVRPLGNAQAVGHKDNGLIGHGHEIIDNFLFGQNIQTAGGLIQN